MPESIALRRKRLLHRSRYRGCLESDLIFGRFAADHLPKLDAAGLDRYEAMLEQSDADVLGWITGQRPAPPAYDNDILAVLRSIRFEVVRA